MKPEEQRIVIAESVGKQHCPNCPDWGYYLYGSSDPEMEQCQFCYTNEDSVFNAPNYLYDLNAMHEVEKTLSARQGGDYDSHLWIIIWRDKTRPACWHATAAQRAEAYLKTIDKWKN